MIRNPQVLKAVAAFLILETLFNTVTPTISWALTGGPSAPEFSSFEPVDTTDMVNLASGDLVYNIPFIEVPGPAGGYPMSLSYHGGIRNDQEASWVGLGWTLNPGAINRTVNGFADDNIDGHIETRDYWDGGVSAGQAFDIGLGFNIAKTGWGVSLNLAIETSQNTFKGFSTNSDGSMHLFNMFGPANQQALDIGISGEGVHVTNTLMGQPFVGHGNRGSTMNSITQTNHPNGSGYIGLLQIGLKRFYTRYWSDQVDMLHSYGSLYAGKGNDKVDDASFFAEMNSYANDIYDLHDRVDQTLLANDHDDADAAKQTGGSLPAYDTYSVLGQGVGGVMQPYSFENGDMKGQNIYGKTGSGLVLTSIKTLEYKTLKPLTGSKKLDFRFAGEFSNGLTVQPPAVDYSQPQWTVGAQGITVPSDGYLASSTKQQLEGSKHIEWFTTAQIKSGQATSAGFVDCYQERGQRQSSMEIYSDYLQPEACAEASPNRYQDNHCLGLSITDNYPKSSLDFIPGTLGTGVYNSLKPTTVSLDDKVGGFMITNENGVTYHYALPVYAYNEYSRTELMKPFKDAATIREVRNNEPYAYTWLLTAVTGPDYVDRSGDGTPNGVLDDADYGYWVKFDYGKWTDSYQWRTPLTGYSADFENEYKQFSYGMKELYYLDAIETKSHKAVFVKSKRKDGKGVTSRLEGGSSPRRYLMRYKYLANGNADNQDVWETATLTYSVSPVSTMKLDDVYLFDKNDLAGNPIPKDGGDQYDNAPISDPYLYPFDQTDDSQHGYQTPTNQYPAGVTIKEGEDFIKVKYHNGDLVYDNEDINAFPALKAKALKIIHLNTDYSLSSGVPNSFGFFSDFTAADSTITCSTQTSSSGCTPETNFDFEWPKFAEGNSNNCVDPLSPSYHPACCGSNYYKDKNAFYSIDPIANMHLPTSPRTPCEPMQTDFAGQPRPDRFDYWHTGKLTLTGIKILGHGGADIIPPTTFAYRNDSPYQAEKFDEWGFYKSDYSAQYLPPPTNTSGGSGNTYGDYSDVELIDDLTSTRKISDASAANVSMWSLSTITTSLGGTINIAYEANTYSKAVYNNHNIFGIAKVEVFNGDRIRFYPRESKLDLSTYFQVDQYVDVKAFVVAGAIGPIPMGTADIYDNPSNKVIAVGSDYVDIDVAGLHDLLESGRTEDFNGSQWPVQSAFIAGAVTTIGDDAHNHYAGGIRVKSITTELFAGHKSSIEYGYNIPGTSLSSGVTSYAPFNAIAVHFPNDVPFITALMDSDDNRPNIVKVKNKFDKVVSTLYEDVLLNNRETPAPGSLYEFVTVRSTYDGNSSGLYTVHQFRPFKAAMVSIAKTSYGPSNSIHTVEVTNETFGIGQLVKTTTYSDEGVPMAETAYGYLRDDTSEPFEETIRNTHQGEVEQAFNKHIIVRKYLSVSFNILDWQDEKAVVTHRKDRTDMLTSVTTRDFRSNTSTRVENNAFDFYSGQATSTTTTDQFGNKFNTSVMPAYRVSDYSGMSSSDIQAGVSGMGLKVKNLHNKHMLAAVASSTTVKLENGVGVSLVSANAQTWSDRTKAIAPGAALGQQGYQQGIWRGRSSYVFVGPGESPAVGADGFFPLAGFSPFTSWTSATLTDADDANDRGPDNEPASWFRKNTVTLYNTSSHGLEQLDMNGFYSSQKMSIDHQHVVASAVNSAYGEFGYYGGEPNSLEPNVSVTGAVQSRTPHTGKNSVVTATPHAKLISYTLTPQTANNYVVSVWSKNPDILFRTDRTGVSVQKTQLGKSEDWYLIEGQFAVPAPLSSITIWVESGNGGATVDDFRVHPMNAAVTSYVYGDFGMLEYILDSDNLFTHYEYDGVGRLIRTSKETFGNGVRITNEEEYKYAGQQ